MTLQDTLYYISLLLALAGLAYSSWDSIRMYHLRNSWIYFLDNDMDIEVVRYDSNLLEPLKFLIGTVYIGRVPEDEELLPMFAHIIRPTPIPAMVLTFLAFYSGVWPLIFTAWVPVYLLGLSIYEALTYSDEYGVGKYGAIMDL